MEEKIIAKKNLIFFILVITIILCINLKNIFLALEQRFFVVDQDAYMHMFIANDFLKNHIWYSIVNPRINAPFGTDTHGWTHVITLLLVSGTLFFNFFMSQTQALFLWSFILPVLFYGITAFAMLWSIKPLQPSFAQQLFILSAFLLNPFMQDLYTPLQVDYDFLLITLGIFYWGLLLRMIIFPKIKWACVTALVAALGMWTSIAFAIPVLISLSILIWFTQIKHKIDTLFLNTFMVVLCFTIALILPIEHQFFLTISYDIVSIVYLTFFLLLFLGLIFYNRYLISASFPIKIIFSLGILLLIFFIMNHFFPGFYYGPYNQVDPYLLYHFFPKVDEFHSPFSIDNSFALAILCYFFIGLGFFYYLYLNEKNDKTQAILVFAALITTGLAAYMYRWNEFAMPLNILLVSFFVAAICQKKMPFIGQLIFIVFMALLPSAILLLSHNYFLSGPQHCRQQLEAMLRDQFLQQPQFKDKKIIFTYSNYGPLLLYYTPYAVVATNDHHNPQGIKDTFNFFTEEEESAKKMIKKRKIDLILLCKGDYPTFNLDKSIWLQPIPLPKEYSLWRLYQPKDL